MLPDPPPSDELRSLGIEDGETRLIGIDEIWWRIHHTQGAHVLAWNAFRTFGPLLRFDPHSLPRGDDPAHGVWCGSSTPHAALGEAFQIDRTIDRERDRPYLTGLSFMRPLAVLDLATDSTGAWATRAGGTFAVSTAPNAAFPDLDGLRYNSRFAGSPCLALFAPAATAMPTRPAMALPLSHPDLATRIAGAATRLGYAVV
jgi:hypothetical protein